MGLLDRLRSRLTRTRSAISDGISGLFRGGREMDGALFSELEELLYTSDLGPLATELSSLKLSPTPVSNECVVAEPTTDPETDTDGEGE